MEFLEARVLLAATPFNVDYTLGTATVASPAPVVTGSVTASNLTGANAGNSTALPGFTFANVENLNC